MSEPEGIQKEPSALPPPAPSDIAIPVRPLEKCPHCGHLLVPEDFTWGQCGICDKRLYDFGQLKQPRSPWLATILFGFLGAIVGYFVGYMLVAAEIVPGSWTMSICGGIGFATGSGITRALFNKQ
jgi:hypothetical protein